MRLYPQASVADAGGNLTSGRDGSRVLGLLVGLGSGIQPTSFLLNTQPVDLLFIVLGLMAIGKWLRGSSLSWRAMRSCAPWLALLVVADSLALVQDQVPGYGVAQVVRDLFAFGIFFVILAHVEDRRRAEQGLVAGLLLAGVVCAILVLTSSDVRPVGTFANPNYAAHFLASTLILALCLRGRWWPFALAAVLLAGMIGTFSFGALSFVGASGAYWAWCRLGGQGGGTRILIRLVVVLGAILLVGYGSVADFEKSSVVSDSEFGSQRYDRSSSVRLEGWEAAVQLVPSYPAGTGPGSAAHGFLVLDRNLELHNDYVAYLVERGILGLAALIGLGWSLWRLTPTGSRSRVILVGFAAASLSRETLNYRHLWVVLAVMVVWDWRDANRAHRSRGGNGHADGQPDQVDLGRTRFAATSASIVAGRPPRDARAKARTLGRRDSRG